MHGTNGLAKVCVLNEKFSLEDIETPIPIDTSVEDWIKYIEENIKNVIVNANFMKEIMKLRTFTEMKCSY